MLYITADEHKLSLTLFSKGKHFQRKRLSQKVSTTKVISKRWNGC